MCVLLSRHIILLLLVTFVISNQSVANISPAQGAILNYTQVMFEYDEIPGADYYVTTIRATGHPEETGAPITVKSLSLAFFLSKGLFFDENYEWYTEAFKNGKLFNKSGLHSFTIGFSFQTNSNWFKSVVEKQEAGQFKDGIIFLDYLGVAVNRKGEPVWYLPIEKDSLDNLKMRNVKLTPAGTVTYLNNTDCFEKDINGNIQWKAPNDGRISGDQQEYYHHDFFKMPDNTYVTSGYRFASEPNIYDAKRTTKVRYNTLIQYDRNGNPVWWWDEEKHVAKKAIYGDAGEFAEEITGTHLNGIAYYQPDDAFILSFRDNSSILKVSHQTGEVLYNLGDSLKKYNPGEVPFAGQHGPSLLSNGSIVVYNNNLDRTGKKTGPSYPVIRVFGQPAAKKQSRKVWEYECVSPKYPAGIVGKEGYASQLPYNDNLLVCMGGANFIFEVTPQKKVVWQCSFQRYNESTAQWVDVNNYRCSYAPSLYPCYFTMQNARVQTISGTTSVRLRINNDGSMPDSYTVIIKDDKNEELVRLPITAIPAGKNKTIIIPLKQLKTKPPSLTVSVQSAVNRNNIREQTVN